jgi:hypothetical protein
MEPFKFYWKTFNAKNGLYFLAVVLILYLVSLKVEFPGFIVGLSVVLAWIVIIFGKPKNKIFMVSMYLLLGVVVTFFHSFLVDTYWPWLISMFVVTFIGTYLIKYGTKWFILGWCLILWYLNLPLTSQIASSQDLILSHVIGSAGVLLLVIITVIWERNKKKKKTVEKEEPEQEPQAAAQLPEWWTIAYSFIVASVVLIGLHIGNEYLTDPIIIANAAFMIIGFTGNVTIWKIGLERMIGITSGVVLGFYLGAYAQSPELGMAIVVVGYFLLLACVEVNNGFVMFLLVLTISYGWGLNDFEVGNTIANEKLIAELVGVTLAGLAIFSLNMIGKFFEPQTIAKE